MLEGYALSTRFPGCLCHTYSLYESNDTVKLKQPDFRVFVTQRYNPPNQPTPTRLFNDFERTYYGPADPSEPFYEFLNRLDDPRAEQARALCNQWFPNYENDAPEEELARFLGNFCGKDDGNHYGAWFELLTHQILVRIGFDVTVEPKLELSGRELTPDFAVTCNGSRIFVGATVVAPDNDPFAPSNCERDAQEKFTQL